MNAYIQEILAKVQQRDAHEPEFLQTVEEVLKSLEPVIEKHPEYQEAGLLERLVEPERVIEFRVPWRSVQQRDRTLQGRSPFPGQC